MDDRRFDGLARAIGQTTTRRQAIFSLLGLVAGGLVGLVARDARAARRGYDGPANADDDWFVAIHGSPSGVPGNCRITGLLRNAPAGATATFHFSSTDGSFSEPVLSLVRSDGTAEARTRGSVPRSTEARCVVNFGGWTSGSDPTIINC